MRRLLTSLLFIVAFLLTPVTHAALWTITLSGLARTPPGTLSGFISGQETAAYTWDPAQLTWAVPFGLSEGPVTATYAGIFNGAESSNHLRAFSLPGTSPHVELIKDAVFDSGPLTASFLTNPQPLSLERNQSQLWHNGIEYAWGAGPNSLTSVFITVRQGGSAPIPEPGTMTLLASSLLGILFVRHYRHLKDRTALLPLWEDA
jgi:hypothetical protein